MGDGSFSTSVVTLAYVREWGACFRCRKPVEWAGRADGAWSAHHRKPRGMGGTSDPVVESVANCLILCGSGTTGCHGWVESTRAVALNEGLLIPRNATTEAYLPRNVYARRLDRSWWSLDEDGQATEVLAEVIPGAWR